MQAAEAGYDQAAEDELLAGIDWREDGYRLFDVSVLNGSSAWGWFEPIAESSALFLRREPLGGARWARRALRHARAAAW